MLVLEGKAKIKTDESTFYNPKMRGLRDLSILFLNAMDMKKYSLLDATSATGVRGIRYVLEAGAGETTFLEINRKAYLNAKKNVSQNSISASVLNESIQQFCNTNDESFDAIDLDPFGSAAPYIYDIMKVARDGTLLMVTATDTAVLCGADFNACVKNYASLPLHNELCHEAAVRILVNYIAKVASQFNFGLEVKLSIANLHYVRIFLTLRHGAKGAVESVKETGFGTFCSKCRSFELSKGIVPRLERSCKNCGSEAYLFGPLWLGKLSDAKVVDKMRASAPKQLEKGTLELLQRLDEELETPFFYSIPKITRLLGIGAVSREKVMQILKKKHRVSRTHFDLDGIKSDANIREVTRAVKLAAKA
ncbi:MAG: tRNA (guanine(10)-N(2))-dimethyltransferase [Candidatus Micrarchaeota archaeon]|nr:tRNA (guanine(10)-N(2))-dimethyltransferase [Candidatus Micrarchaeota archaeon]